MNKPLAEILDTSFIDGIQNLITNLGTSADKRAYTRFTNGRRLSQQFVGQAGNSEIDDMYRANWVAGKVIDIIPDDMTREWRTLNGDDPDVIAEIEKEEKRLNLVGQWNEAHKWARLYGTSGILMAVDDGKELYEELDPDDLRPGALRYLKAVDRTMMYQDNLGEDQVEITLNPLDPNFGLPTYYRFTHNSQRIHNSRILRFDGVKLPHYQMQQNGYMSDSVLDRLYDPILDFATSTQSASSMIHNMNVDVVSIENLMALLQSKDGEALIQKRWSMVALMRSFQNMLIIDSKEKVETRTQSFAGLPDLIDKFSKILAAAGDIPATRLLGSSPGGLNATGDSDLRNYYNMLRSKQRNQYSPLLDRLDLIMCKSLALPDHLALTYDWNSLDHLTETEKATLESTRSTRDANYIREGVIDELTVAKELEKNKTYSAITPELLEESDPEEEEEEDDPIDPEEEEEEDEEDEE